MTGHFVPPHPPRRPGPVAVWRGFVGERARTLVYGWSERAFREPYMLRNVLGYRVHIPLEPDSVQRVLLDNAANYQKPRLVKRLLDPVIGRGLLSSDGSLWREQRRIVAAVYPAPSAALSFRVRRGRGIPAAGRRRSRHGGKRRRDHSFDFSTPVQRRPRYQREAMPYRRGIGRVIGCRLQVRLTAEIRSAARLRRQGQIFPPT